MKIIPKERVQRKESKPWLLIIAAILFVCSALFAVIGLVLQEATVKRLPASRDHASFVVDHPLLSSPKSKPGKN
jgi:hypothetical protein